MHVLGPKFTPNHVKKNGQHPSNGSRDIEILFPFRNCHVRIGFVEAQFSRRPCGSTPSSIRPSPLLSNDSERPWWATILAPSLPPSDTLLRPLNATMCLMVLEHKDQGSLSVKYRISGKPLPLSGHMVFKKWRESGKPPTDAPSPAPLGALAGQIYHSCIPLYTFYRTTLSFLRVS